MLGHSHAWLRGPLLQLQLVPCVFMKTLAVRMRMGLLLVVDVFPRPTQYGDWVHTRWPYSSPAMEDSDLLSRVTGT